MKTKVDLAAMRAAANALACEGSDHVAAIDEERTAEALVLESVLKAYRPAFPWIVSRLIRSELMGDGNGNEYEDEYFPTRALVLQLKPSARLVMYEDGSLAMMTDEYPPDAPPVRWSDPTYLTPREAMNLFDLNPCIDALTTAVEGQLGKRKPKAQAARRRATELRSMATSADELDDAMMKQPDDDIPF